MQIEMFSQDKNYTKANKTIMKQTKIKLKCAENVKIV